MAEKPNAQATSDDYLRLGNQLRKQGQPVAACRAYRRAVRLDPASIDAYISWGDLLVRKQKYAAAIDKYSKAIELSPDTSLDFDKWVSALENVGRDKRAGFINKFDQLAQKKAGFADVYLEWARALVERKELVEADEKFEKAVKIDPKNSEAYNDWGDTLYTRHQYADSAARYLAAIESEEGSINYENWVDTLDHVPSDERSANEVKFHKLVKKSKSARAYTYWGNALAARGRFEEAYDKYQQAIKIDHKDSSVFSSWGDTLLQENKDQEALAKYISVLKLTPSSLNYDSWISALDGVNLHQREAAINEVQKIAVEPSHAHIYREWGISLLKLERYEDASKQFDKANRVDPSQAETLNAWAFALARLGNYTGASEKYREAIRIGVAKRKTRGKQRQEYASYYAYWANMLSQHKDYKRAISRYLAAIKRKFIKLDYGDWVIALGNCDEAHRERVTEEIWQFAKTDPDLYAEFYSNWGLALSKKKDFASAIRQYRKAIALNPNGLGAQSRLADALADSDKPADAIREYLKILEKDPQQADVARLIDVLDKVSKDDRRSALKNISEIAVDDPGGISIFKSLGEELYSRKRYEEAMEMYKRATELDCEDSELWSWLGDAFMQLGRYRESIEGYQRATEIDPNDALSYNAWGSNLVALRDYAGAIGKFEKAIDVSRDSTERVSPNMNWGDTLRVLKDYAGALEKYEEAEQIAEDKTNAYFTWAYGLAEASRYEEAREKYGEAIKADTEHVLATYAVHNIADSFYREGLYEKGRREWEKAREAYSRTQQWAIDKLDADYFQNYGNMMQSIFGKLDEAKQIYLQGLKLDPNHVGILMALVSLYLEEKDEGDNEHGPSPYLEARRYYERAERILSLKLKRGDDDPMLPLLFGQLIVTLDEYMTDKEMESAEDYLSKALAIDPKSALGYTNLGVLYARKEDFGKAIRCFTDALKLAPDDLNVWSNLAETYLKAATAENAEPGLKEKAESEFKKILEAAPNHVESIIGLGEVYKAMGDQAKDEELYIRAIEQFDRGIKTADSARGSKKLKKKELDAALYSAGYAKVKLYETAKEERLLQEASDYFKQAKDDPKARRALDRVEKRVAQFSAQRAVEKFGPRIILLGAAMIFLVTQLSVFVKWPIRSLGPIDYTVLSFGSLLFTVAGLSLRQLLKLKVPGIELEKSAVEQITPAGALGLPK